MSAGPAGSAPPDATASLPGEAVQAPSSEASLRPAYGLGRRARVALEAAGMGAWEYDAETGALVWDQRIYEVTEIDPSVSPRFDPHFLEAVHPDDRARVGDSFAALLVTGDGARLSLRCRVIGRRTGREVVSALEGRVVAVEGGRLKIFGTAHDVTQEARLTEELVALTRDLEARVAAAVAQRGIWADMFENADEPIAAVDLDLRFIAVNRAYADAFRRYFGKPAEVGASLPELLDGLPYPEVRRVALDSWTRALAGETVEVARSPVADGSRVYDIKFSPLDDREGRRIGAFQYSRDVTLQVQAVERLQETERQLYRSQKMEALGQLTGGVAHDFNNILQVVGGNLQLMRQALEDGSTLARRADNALAAVQRGARLSAQLLAFARRQPLDPKPTNLNRLLGEIEDLLRRAAGEGIELRVFAAETLGNILIDPGQLETAILNLVVNARDAMDGRGRLTIEAAQVSIAALERRYGHDLAPGDYIALSVTDTGAGIPPEVIDHVFEPFFTTKPEGKGTGLGLSMVYGLVTQSGGAVRIYSEPGEGACVRLYIPRTGDDERRIESPDGAVDTPGGSETILVVEDDPAVQDVAVSMLEGLGYRVLRASNAERAQAVLESGVEIDLLFTDVVMPGRLRSPELARSAQEMNPRLKVLFTSGYAENAVVHGGRLDPGVELLSKPYRREDLAWKVRSVLDAEPPALL